MVVYRDGKRALSNILANDVLVEEIEDLRWLREIALLLLDLSLLLFDDDFRAQSDASVADINAGASN